MTEADLRERLAYWQKRLRLQDWDVHLKVKRGREMVIPDKGGTISCHLPLRHAWLDVFDPADYPPDSEEEQDMERTLVHELLHIYTAALGLPSEGPKHVAEEQMINAVAAALVALERKEG